MIHLARDAFARIDASKPFISRLATLAALNATSCFGVEIFVVFRDTVLLVHDFLAAHRIWVANFILVMTWMHASVRAFVKKTTLIDAALFVPLSQKRLSRVQIATTPVVAAAAT